MGVNKTSWVERRKQEAMGAKLAQQEADIQYIAMMADIELGEDEEEGPDNE